MKYTPATYKEYCKASKYAKLRYKFGVYIQLVSFILLLFLVYYTTTNIEEMKSNPVDYAEKKLGVMCYYPILVASQTLNYGDYRSITNITEG